MTANVLVFTPTYSDLLRSETIQSVAGQDFAGAWTHEISQHNPHNDAGLNVWAQYRRGRDMTLAGNYDAMLTVEHDMDLPLHALRALHDTDAPVVYGVYLFRHKQYMLSAFRYDNDKNIGMSLANYPQELDEYKERGWAQVSGVGLGCTLIRRDVLERYKFERNRHRYPDMAFAEWCLHNQVKQIARFDVMCRHWCEEDRRWLETERHGVGQIVKVMALQTLNAHVVDRVIHFEKGQVHEIPMRAVADLERAGFVRLVPEPEADEPKRTTKRKAKGA